MSDLKAEDFIREKLEPVQDRKDGVDYWSVYELYTWNDLEEALTEFAELKANGVEKRTEQALPIRDVNGCWVVSNTERPKKGGIYTTIDSHGIEGETLFDNKHWIIRPDRNPVQMWLKPNCR